MDMRSVWVPVGNLRSSHQVHTADPGEHNRFPRSNKSKHLVKTNPNILGENSEQLWKNNMSEHLQGNKTK